MKRALLIVTIVALAWPAAHAAEDFATVTANTGEVARHYFDRYLAKDWDAIEALSDERTSFADPTARLVFGGGVVEGRAAVVKKFREGYASIAFMRATIVREIIAGDVAVFEATLTFAFRQGKGDDAKIRTFVNVPFVLTLRVKDGRVTEHRDYADYREYFRQLSAPHVDSASP